MAPTEADSSNYRKISLGIIMSWAYSLIWTLPPLFGWSHYGPEGPGTTCSVDWTAKTANNISYIICLFIFCLIVPFLVIVFCYGKLLSAIRQVSQYGYGGDFQSPCRTCRGEPVLSVWENPLRSAAILRQPRWHLQTYHVLNHIWLADLNKQAVEQLDLIKWLVGVYQLNI